MGAMERSVKTPREGSLAVSHTSQVKPAQNKEKRKRKRQQDSGKFAGPVSREGGEAEDDFEGAGIVDLQEEAVVLANAGPSADAEFLTGQQLADEGHEPKERTKSKKRKAAQQERQGQESSVVVENSVVSNGTRKKGKKGNEMPQSSAGRAHPAKEENDRPAKAKTSGGVHENPRALPLPECGAALIEQADWFQGCFTRRFGGELSALESSEIREEHIASGSGSGAPLSSQLKAVCGPEWKSKLLGNTLEEGQEAGSPTVLLVAASAKRCNDLLKSFPEFHSDCPVAKLFAKHFKIEEQMTALKRRVNIAGGTPNRLLKLADMGALSLTSLEVLVLDLQRDAKGLTLVDIPETRNDFWKFFHLHAAQRIQGGRTKLFFNLV